MQKKLIALAVAGLASTAAFAQSNVTIYGRIDTGVMYRNGDSGNVAQTEGKYEIASGVQSGSRLGFKGVEDLGNGLKALFEIEYGIGIDQTAAGTTNAAWTNRHSYVGLTGGFGTALVGRLDGVRYGVFGTYDPFANGTIANFTQMTPQVDRADNAIAYVSPRWAGLGFLAAYSTNIAGPEAQLNTATLNTGNGSAPNSTTNNDRTLNTLMAMYDNGPISARLDFEQVVPTNTQGKTWVATAGASYDLGVAKVSALYDIFRSNENLTATRTADLRAWLVGVKAPIGKFTAKGMYGQVQNFLVGSSENADSAKWGLGVDYNLSKRTNLYANYGQIRNDGGAARTITASANSNTGYGTRGFDFGIAHQF